QSWEFTDVRGGIADDQEQSELWQRLDAGIDPIKDRSKTKCAAGDGLHQEPLRLSPLLSNGDEFLMELGIDFRSKLYRVGHDLTSKHSLSSRLSAEVKNTLD